jgi:hypothetical protein
MAGALPCLPSLPPTLPCCRRARLGYGLGRTGGSTTRLGATATHVLARRWRARAHGGDHGLARRQARTGGTSSGTTTGTDQRRRTMAVTADRGQIFYYFFSFLYISVILFQEVLRFLPHHPCRWVLHVRFAVNL